MVYFMSEKAPCHFKCPTRRYRIFFVVSPNH